MDPREAEKLLRDLYREHAVRVRRLLWCSGVSPQAAVDDCAQETWLRVYRGLSSYNAEKGTWRARVSGAALFAARDFHRARRLTREDPTDDLATGDFVIATSEPDPEAQVQRSRRMDALLRFVATTLPADLREPFLLHHVGESTIPEAAEQLGIPVNVAKARIEAAGRALRAAYLDTSAREGGKLRATVLPLAALPLLGEEGEWERVLRHVRRYTGGLYAPPRLPALTLGARRLVDPFVSAIVGAVAGGAAVWWLLRPPAITTPAGVMAETERAPVVVQGAAPIMDVDVAAASAAPTSKGEAATVGPPDATATAKPRPAGQAHAVAVSPTAHAGADAHASGALLGRARAALSRSPDVALHLVAEHQARFGSLDADGRLGVEIEALARSGRAGEAVEKASALAQRSPSRRPDLERTLGRQDF